MDTIDKNIDEWGRAFRNNPSGADQLLL
jgi:hypothetical protein